MLGDSRAGRGDHTGAGDLALVDFSGVRRNVNIALLEGEGVGPGDWVLMHVGFAMAKIDETEAKATLSLLEELGQAYAESPSSQMCS